VPHQLDGVLAVDKPPGPTSHDVVARIRRLTGCRRVGHTGTLDPMASGVLALVLGRATRLAQFLSRSDKSYDATIRLGVETDTYDAMGRETARWSQIAAPGEPAWPTRDALEGALRAFHGEYRQTPPPFSAKKLGGVPAYTLARRVRPVSLAPVTVEVTSLELIEAAGDVVRLRLVCSAGFYVRGLAHDLGRALGCGAHLVSLRRTRAGEFGLDRAASLDRLEVDPGEAAIWLVPVERLLADWPSAHLTGHGAARARHGNPVGPGDVDVVEDLSPAPAGVPRRVRLFDPAGRLVAIATASDEGAGWPLRPTVVLV
jgi:tRNA pseudouridine55 synthase